MKVVVIVLLLLFVEIALSYRRNFFFNLFSKKWMIRDGEGNAPSSSGTWIFTTNPVIISNEMVVKLWGNELLFRYK